MRILFAILLVVGFSRVSGANLTVIELRVKDGLGRAVFTFSPDSAPIPKFFQSYDKHAQWYHIYFLETISSITLGSFHAAGSEAPFPEVMLEAAERLKQGSIRNFLKVGFPMPHSAKTRFPAKKAGPGILVLELGTYSGPEWTWTINSQTSLRKIKSPALAENKKGPDDRSKNLPKADTPEGTFTLQGDEEVFYKIIKEHVNVRKGPGVDFPSMGKASKNERVGYVHREGDWLVVNWGEKTGFIRQDMLAKVNNDGEVPEWQDGIAGEPQDKLAEKLPAEELLTEEALNQAYRKNEASLKQKNQKARIEMEKEQETQFQELQKEQQALLADMKKESEQLKKENRAQQEAQIEAMRREFEEKLNEEREKNKKLLKALKAEHEKSLETLRQENQFALKKLKQGVKKEREKLKKAHREEMKTIESTFEQQQRQIQKEQDKTLAAIQEKHKLEKERRIRTLQKQVMSQNAQSSGFRDPAAGKKATYNSYGSRDPFLPIRFGNSENLVTVDQMKLVGVIWNAESPIAVLEHQADPEVSATLREGDRVDRGRVMEITKESARFEISEYGVLRTFVLKLASAKGGS